MALYKKEVLIRPTSTVSAQGAKDWTRNWLNDTFQNASDNKDANGAYIDHFFADIFDARDGNIYRIFSDACSNEYAMDTLDFTILDNVELNRNINDINDAVTRTDENLTALEEIVLQPKAVII